MPNAFPILYGPTASGKSALGLALHARLRTLGVPSELVTADAFQVYRGMDIGTAKPSDAERASAPHHLIDIAEPHAPEPFTLDQWLERAEGVITSLRARGVLPIVVGGTSLYIQALLFGLFSGPAADTSLRAELGALDVDQLRRELIKVDPDAAERIHPSDTRRSIRAIEVHRLTGVPISEHQRQWSESPPRADAKLFILSWPVEQLNPRINSRVKTMIAEGLVEEVKALAAQGPLNRQAAEALGYKQLLQHLGNTKDFPLDETIERIKIETRRFAKNQRTWMKRLTISARAVTLAAESQDAETLAGQVCTHLGIPGTSRPQPRA